MTALEFQWKSTVIMVQAFDRSGFVLTEARRHREGTKVAMYRLPDTFLQHLALVRLRVSASP